MIDFSSIHAFKHGQRASFEELVCQLAKIETAPTGSKFKRVNGDGGDGGVEAYWTAPNGKKTGYQAKFHLRPSEIDWEKIDGSVRQAFDTHPEIERYVVALPCDLTERSGTKKKGKTGWERWDSRVEKWQEFAREIGLQNIEFEPWTQSELISKLTKPEANGLREYFFGDTELTLDWFKIHMNSAVAALDERFHPEDHVDVRLERLAEVICRSRKFSDELFKAFELTKTKKPYPEKVENDPDNLMRDALNEFDESFLAVVKRGDQLSDDLSSDWELGTWRTELEKLRDSSSRISGYFWSESREIKDEKVAARLRQSARDFQDFEERVDSVFALLVLAIVKAEHERFAFVHGYAGTGKSHLLAKCGLSALDAGNPAILICGQQLNDSNIWTQIAEQLGLTGRSVDQVLSLLDAAGRSFGARVLILVDAINEGPGSRFWRQHIDSYRARLKPYSYISCIMSCRSEYFGSAVSDTLRNNTATFQLKGFETAEEQRNAARVYLDRRGISRPSTPWLAPEFINPLFLRSICVALERQGKTELPAGLNGTKAILKEYVSSHASTVMVQRGLTANPARRMERALLDAAGVMLQNRTDFLELEASRNLLERHFGASSINDENDWLSLFLNNGLFRKDPHPHPTGGFGEDDEVIRFSFQRFQDFLMAEQALEGLDNVDEIFRPSGRLDFCWSDDYVEPEWRGLVSALAIVLPEKFGVEVFDVLPFEEPDRMFHWSLVDDFIESAKWRERSAFSDRTLEILNQHTERHESLNLLVEVALSEDHPWNADFLHQNLIRRKLPQRDAFWTEWVNGFSTEADNCIGILIEWCLLGQVEKTSPVNQRLAALVLCWCFTSSNRQIRDKACKALTNLLVYQPDMFPSLMEKFSDVDDIYVLERLLAAAYGACCLNPVASVLSVYSAEVYKGVFERGVPPLSLLLRDYALGIMELAKHKNCLADGVEISRCHPPYNSSRPQFSISETRLEEIAKRAGGDQILDSCTGFIGDFGTYEIAPIMSQFLRVTKNQNVPLSDEQKVTKFYQEHVAHCQERRQKFAELEDIKNPYRAGLISISLDGRDRKPSKTEFARWKSNVENAHKAFLSLLERDEAKEFNQNIAEGFYAREHNNPNIPQFDVVKAKRWVAARAYRLGWTEQLFEQDRSRARNYSRGRAKTERIGKKYQWIALGELTCRLCDNYWLSGDYGALPKIYGKPTDLTTIRDIDPTSIHNFEAVQHNRENANAWAAGPVFDLPSLTEDELPGWPFKVDPSTQMKTLPIRVDPDGVHWVVAYEHRSSKERYRKPSPGEHGARMEEFRILATSLVARKDAQRTAKYFEERNEIDAYHWGLSDETNGGLLFELPWRNTWVKHKWIDDEGWRMPKGVEYAKLAVSYAWERDMDASEDDGNTFYLPQPWLVEELNLEPDRDNPGIWRNAAGEIVFQEFRGERAEKTCLLRLKDAERLFGENNTLISVLVSERNTWPGGSNNNASWRRSEAVRWTDGGRVRTMAWKKDNANGTSKSSLPSELASEPT